MFNNPVKIIETNKWINICSSYLKELKVYNPLIITSNGHLKRIKLQNIFPKETIYSDVNSDPTIDSCQLAINFIKKKKFDGVIALGGGSVMDTAKAVKAAMSSRIFDILQLLDMTNISTSIIPSIFIPTTHGTGSEVTMWGTIWDNKNKKKFSISDKSLYPDIAILDGNLTLSLPIDISIITTMDALSHSFESIWNKNSNALSSKYAIEAITIILKNIELLKQNPSDLNVRNNLLIASSKAGLAFSNTKTAAAHSISYPLTLNYNIPHGIASSLTLISLLKINSSCILEEITEILSLLGYNDINELIKKIKSIPFGYLKYSLQEWGVHKDELESLANQSFTKDRINNNIVDLKEDNVKSILNEIF